LATALSQGANSQLVESTLNTLHIATGEQRVVYRVPDHFEAPNWSKDGKFFLFNVNGSLYTLPVQGGTPTKLDTGRVSGQCNNDHGFSPKGDFIAMSCSSENDGNSHIYVVPSTGGTPQLITPLGPSYWHGWSPDGKTLAYCGSRNTKFDIYSIPVDLPHQETRLTTAIGLNDGPDFSADGRYIYFNSQRTGMMKIWRMFPNGTNQEQVTFGTDYNDWFGHPSPDGQWLVFISFDKTVDPGDHPPNKNVWLRLVPLAGGEPKIIATLFGGQGTINVPSWSPDSQNIAFVSYRLL